MSYQFTNSWFADLARENWEEFIPVLKPKKILEIGSYEGASICYLIETLGNQQDLQVFCADTWEGGIEHQSGDYAVQDIAAVEARFDANVRAACAKASRDVTVEKCKLRSDRLLAKLITEGHEGSFDFVYVDGSHQAPDVLADAVLGFRLLRIGGVMGFDDYLWAEELPGGKDLLQCPKPAVDAFTNMYARKLQIVWAPLYQLYIRKTAD